jgi:molybdopterin-biosynthesis enzyme MoeA-like protein
MHSKSIDISVRESVIAKQLTNLQIKYPLTEIGSYPQDGYTQIVVSSYYTNLIDQVIDKIQNFDLTEI